MFSSSDLLFVYGTLRSDSTHPMARLLAANATLLGRGSFRGRRFAIDWYWGAVASDDPRDAVEGDVYRLHDPAFLLTQLDAYEETGPGFAEPVEFRRVLHEARLDSGERVQCWLYLYARPTDTLLKLRQYRPNTVMGEPRDGEQSP